MDTLVLGILKALGFHSHSTGIWCRWATVQRQICKMLFCISQSPQVRFESAYIRPNQWRRRQISVVIKIHQSDSLYISNPNQTGFFLLCRNKAPALLSQFIQAPRLACILNKFLRFFKLQLPGKKQSLGKMVTAGITVHAIFLAT